MDKSTNGRAALILAVLAILTLLATIIMINSENRPVAPVRKPAEMPSPVVTVSAN